jgi:hypothetical protein
MAVVHVQDCPHCGARNAAFTLRGEVADPDKTGWSMLFTCNRCSRPLCATGVPKRLGGAPSNTSGDLGKAFDAVVTWPRVHAPEAPAHCPEAVARAFVQADSLVHDAAFSEPTVSMDRRALDLATRHIDPELPDGPLARRLDALAERHLLTPALRDWAHELRTLGNESLHNEVGVTHLEARQTHELTRFVLLYLFTLPAQVRAGREARQNG